MTEKEAQEVLDELNEIKPEQLEGNSKRLFEAIMQIADERDEACKDIKKKDKQIEKYQNMLVTNDMLHVIECENKDKIIDLMAEQLAGLAIFNIDKDETLLLNDKEEVKQYFENKAKELINK